MIRTLRAFFLSRLMREQLLLAGIAVVVAAIWFSSLAGRAGRFYHAVRITSLTLKDQAHWLANRKAICPLHPKGGELGVALEVRGSRVAHSV